MALQYSAPINIVRYRNGTLLKLTAATHEFTSYDYDHETDTGTFQPTSISITATLDGSITIGAWRYSTDGVSWSNVVDGWHGMTIGTNRLTLQATSDLYANTNSTITIMCVSDDGRYYDTVTIARTIDPIIAFSKVYTDINLTKDKISLIASDEQLQQFTETSTMMSKVASIDQKADAINLNVTTNYSTKANTLANEILYYQASDRSEGVTRETGTWTTDVTEAVMDETNKYLWSYRELVYGDGHSAYTEPMILSVHGTHGINTTQILLYKRSATSNPQRPTGDLTYSFADNSLTPATNLNGWTTTIPTGSNPCYVTSAVASNEGNTDVISSSEWTAPQKLFENGASAYSYNLLCDPASLVRDKDGNLNQETITFTATRTQGANAPEAYNGRFKIEEKTGNNWATIYTGSSNESSYNHTVVNSDATMVRVTLYMAGGTTAVVDTQTVPIASDGATGASGESAYTVMLSNEAYTFAGDTEKALPATLTLQIYAYKGAGRIVASIGNITGQISGALTATKQNDGTTNAAVEVTVTSALTTRQGVLTIPVTVDSNKTFNLHFSWALALVGLTGSHGVNTATLTLYQYSSMVPVKPNGDLTYNFTDKTLTGSAIGNWTLNAIPQEESALPIWVTMATASGAGDTDVIKSNEWSAPKKLAENGTNGLNQATITMYQRSPQRPSVPTDKITYHFDTGALDYGTLPWLDESKNPIQNENNTGFEFVAPWSRAYPSNEGEDSWPCWVTTAVAISDKKTYEIPANAWSTAVKLVENGVSVSIDNIKYAVGTSGTQEPSTGWVGYIPKVEQGQWLWCRTTYSDGRTSSTCSYIGTDGEDGNSVYVKSVTKVNKTTTVVLEDSEGKTSTMVIQDGQDGPNGTPGLNGYVHTAWANSQDGTVDFSTSVSLNKQYMGVYTDNTEADSTNPSAYSWAKIKGEPAYVYDLQLSANSITKTENGTLYPATITATATVAEGTNTPSEYQGYFKVEELRGSTWTELGRSSKTKSYTYNIQSTSSSATMARVSLYQDSAFKIRLDIQSIPIIADGGDAYTVFLTNEAHIFQAGTDAAVAGTATSKVIARKGTQLMPVTIGNITSPYTGMTAVADSENGTTNAGFTVTVTPRLTTRQGVLTIPITVNGIGFTREFSWSLGIVGENGTNGLNNAILHLYKRVEEGQQSPSAPTQAVTYVFSTGAYSNVPTGWTAGTIPTETPTYPCYETTAAAISDEDSVSVNGWSTPVKIVEYGDDGLSIVSDQPIYYATDSSTTPAAPSTPVTTEQKVYSQWTKGIPPLTGTNSHIYTCHQMQLSDGSYRWSTVVEDDLYVDINERLKTAEINMTDEHIVMTVRDQYSTITSNTKNLLLDTNAPTLDPVDAVDQTRTITGNGTWGAISSSPGFKISYGVIISASYSDTIVSWVGKDDFESCTLEVGKIYTISYYYNVHNKTGTYSTRVYFRTIVEYENGDTQSDTKGTTTNTNKWISAKYTFTAQSDAAVIKFRVNTSNGITADVELAGFMLTETEDAIDWNDGVHVPGDFVTTEVMESTIEQSADAIRLKADKIAWQSTGSSMTEEGYFKCNSGLIGSSSSTTGIHINGDGVYSGSRSAFDSTNAGFFLGGDGSLSIGTQNDTSYIKYDEDDGLRIKSENLSWVADESEMDSEGRLIVRAARFDGNWSATTGGDGLIIGNASIVSMSHGSPQFAITMPYYDTYYIDKYIEKDPITGEISIVDDGKIEPPVEEQTSVTFTNETLDRYGYYDDEVNISVKNTPLSINTGDSYGIRLGYNGTMFWKIQRLFFPKRVYEEGNYYDAYYQAYTGGLSTVLNNPTNYEIVNGIICTHLDYD